MKTGKTFKVFLLVILLGLPVGWYLFLQVFGENQFELPIIDGPACDYPTQTIVITDTVFSVDEGNQYARITDAAKVANYRLEVAGSECLDSLSESVFLFDKSRNLRGSYLLTIEEVDRFLIELDLLITLEGREK